MKLNRKLRLQLLLQNGLFVVLLLGLAAAIAWVTRDVKVQWDLTQSQRNTLSQASAESHVPRAHWSCDRDPACRPEPRSQVRDRESEEVVPDAKCRELL